MSSPDTHEIEISRGKIVRPGFYRSPDGDSGVEYARTVATGVLDACCVFCPDSLPKRHNIIDNFGEGSAAFSVVRAKPPYAHFDGQRVLDHVLVIPKVHVESLDELDKEARTTLDEYLDEMQHSVPEDRAFQRYTRDRSNPSKSVSHLHTHGYTLSLDPVSNFEYNAITGVTRLEFVRLTPGQVSEVIASRTKK